MSIVSCYFACFVLFQVFVFDHGALKTDLIYFVCNSVSLNFSSIYIRIIFKYWLNNQTNFFVLIRRKSNIDLAFCYIMQYSRMHGSAKLQYPPLSIRLFCSCDNVHHKQEVCFRLYLLGQIVT